MMRRYVMAAVAAAVLAAAGSTSARAQAGAVERVLTLREAVEASLEDNGLLAQARHGHSAARAQVREAWGNVMPTVNFNAAYTRNLDLPTTFLPAMFFDTAASPDEVIGVQFGADNNWFAQARAEQPLFNAAAFLGVGAADRYETLQRETVRGQAHQVATETRLRYYDVLLAQEQARLTGNSVSRVRQVLEETRSLNRAGLASEYDVIRLEVELANLEPNLARSENAGRAARRALAVAMGVESLDGVTLAGSLLTLELPALPGREVVLLVADGAAVPASTILLDRAVAAEALPAERVLELARRNRSDLRQIEMMRELRETERRVEMSQFLPRVSLFATWTALGQGDAARFFGEHNFSARAVGVEVSIPLFSGLQRPARVSQIGAVVQQVTAQLEHAREQAASEVRTLLDQTREAYDRAMMQRRAVERANRGFEIARSEYRAGTGSQLQVTDAELALRQTEFNYAQAVYDYLTAQARLDAAIGLVPLVDAGDDLALQG